jgi:hypothetical protein
MEMIPDISLIEKQLGPWSPFDLIALLVIRNPVPNARIANGASSVSSRAHRLIRRRPA